MEAIDLLTDFVGRPKIDAQELDKERGVVIQEIQRYKDQPAAVAEELIDRAAFGDHPLGRTVLGPEDHLRTFTREGIVAFRERRWSGERGGAFLVGNLDHVDRRRHGRRAALGASPTSPPRRRTSPRRRSRRQKLVEERETNQSHLRMIYRPDLDVTDREQRAAFSIYATLLGGSMGSRLFDEIREQRGLCYSVYAVDHAAADVGSCSSASGLESSKCGEAYAADARDRRRAAADGPTEEEVERARAYAAGRRVLAFENTNAVARYAAGQQIVFGEPIDPDEAIAALDRVTFPEVVEAAARVDPDELAVAVVGPHSADEF